jgi:hypothetical protein
MLYLQFSCPIFPIYCTLVLHVCCLVCCTNADPLHLGASYVCTIEVEIGFLGIRCIQWQDLDVMPDAVIRFFSCRHGYGKRWTQIIPISCRSQIWACVSYLHIWKSDYVTNKTYCWLKKKFLKNCSTWVCTFSSIKREPNLVPLYRTHLVLYPK